MAPRRALVPLAALVLLLVVFLAEGAVGASVIDRYLLGGGHRAAAVLRGLPRRLVRCSSPGSWLRRVWIAGAAALLVFGAASAATTLNLSSLRTTLAYHEDFHKGLARGAARPRGSPPQLRRCPLLSLPNNKLIPDARWILDSVGQHDIVARSQARADVGQGLARARATASARGSVAVYPLGSAVFFEAIVDVGDDPRDQVPLPGFRRIYTSRYYAVYAQLLRAARAAGRAPARRRERRRAGVGAPRWAWAGLALVLAGGLALRLWGVARGCPSPTTPTRPTTSCRTRSRCSAKAR